MSRTLPRTLQGTALHGRNDGFDSLLPTPSIYAKACPYAEASGYAEASLDKSGDKSLTHRRPTANGSPFGKLRAGRRLTQMNAVGLRQKQLATDVASHCAKASPYAPGLQETRRETGRETGLDTGRGTGRSLNAAVSRPSGFVPKAPPPGACPWDTHGGRCG
jgi:hypothetical protein